MQDTLKQSAEQLAQLRDRVQTALQSQFDRVEAEGRRVLNQLGAELDAEDHSLAAVVKRLREKNPSLKVLGRNLDIATYDLRGRLNWNASMMAAYARMKAGERFESEVLPRLQKAREDLEVRVRQLLEKSGNETAEETAK